MPTRPPFVDLDSGTIDTAQIKREAVPLAKLVLLFGAIALIPLALVFLSFGNSIVGALFTALAQFVLAVGTGIVLIYCVARGVALAGE